MHFLRYVFLSLLFLFQGCLAQNPLSDTRLLEYIQNRLPQYGVIKNSDGFIYVDVDDEYIHTLVTLLQKDGFEEPPYFGNADLLGAHITVIDREEGKKYGITEVQECGKIIYFTPKECKVVQPPNWKRIDTVYLIVLEAPELDLIRKKYGLPKREYDFHITIGVKPKMAKPV